MDLQTKVQKALDRAVEEGRECGCQAALFIDGKLEVSAWAGWTDWTRRQAVDEDTIFPVYSVGKPPCSAVLHRLVEKGLIDYTTRIGDVWPEFACNGKETMQVWHVLSYRAGLFTLPKSTPEEMADFWLMTKKMAQARPAYAPGTKQQYHPVTYGWLAGGIACHVLGRREFPTIFRELVGEPAGMDRFFYGAGEEEAVNGAWLVPDSQGHSYDVQGLQWMNQPLARRCCNPAACAMSNALSVARFYAALDRGELLAPETIVKAARPWRSPDDPFEFVHENWTLFGLGFALSGPIGDVSRNIGHAGWNGAQGVLDRKRHLAVGMTRNLFADPNAAMTGFYDAIGFADRDWPKKKF